MLITKRKRTQLAINIPKAISSLDQAIVYRQIKKRNNVDGEKTQI